MILPSSLPGRGAPPRYANSGAPMSRTRRERIVSSLLGGGGGPVHCPLRIRLGLHFGNAHPVQCLEALLEAEGLRDPEALRACFSLPAGCLIVRPVPEAGRRLDVAATPRSTVLEQALWLGLCTGQVFDPGRPVLWTETSLTRVVELYEPRGFYA